MMKNQPQCRFVYEIDRTFNERLISRCIEKVLLQHKVNGHITILGVSCDRIKVLQRMYKKIDKVTDVLSFPAYEEGDIPHNTKQPVYLGEIVVCPEAIRPEKGTTYEWEVCHLITHSVFHLLGIHHEHSEELHDTLHKEEVRVINEVYSTHNF